MSTVPELLVAAIDFGTTYSGVAYSFRDEYNRDPLKINALSTWSDGATMATLKTPTVVLFDQNGQFHSFGFEAETKYADLANKDKHIGWRYFRRFKMKLFSQKKLRIGLMLEDEQGEKMEALKVFTESIRYLKTYLVTELRSRGRAETLLDTDIHWVLTVPAIWNDAAKQFMIRAAEEAGIPSKQLTLAYEPEAAAVFCKEELLSTDQREKLTPFSPGARFMVVDLGGGTVDITSHEVGKDGSLQALYPPSGGDWGGTSVDRNIYKFLERMFGKNVLDEFSKECKPDKLDMDRMIELKKRCLCPSVKDDDTVAMKLPTDLYEIYEEVNDVKFDQKLQCGDFKSTVKKKRDRLNISNKVFVDMFNEPVEQIINKMKDLLSQDQLRGVNTLMMVGGFSESPIVRHAIQVAFPELRVIIPEQGSIAIVKGAVMYGHNMNSISSRKSPFTYGISTAEPFDERKHPRLHRVVTADGTVKCEDIFSPFIQKGETLIPGKPVSHLFNAPSRDMRLVTVEIYRSNDAAVIYTTDEGCRKTGEITLELTTDVRDEKAMINVDMQFGGTMITVKARESGTENEVHASFNCLI